MPTRPLSSLYFTALTIFSFAMACSTFTSFGKITCKMVLLNMDLFISRPGTAPLAVATGTTVLIPASVAGGTTLEASGSSGGEADALRSLVIGLD